MIITTKQIVRAVFVRSQDALKGRVEFNAYTLDCDHVVHALPDDIRDIGTFMICFECEKTETEVTSPEETIH